ncbi:hypothetical protein AA0311_0325 [Asaia bogorensis NBRC 16594]|uniref:Uncharacterized protein n=1 Tax=Asaia bogorensis NBRC 16594 TaxID=1231624 RepID=A0AAN4R2M7_9PROT|nr:hypothetical protein AA0311_0325 [Asaia bogorensis NBRC 16594]GEL53272.1 hypothetical protein ABO01nite_12790 [Asaia bogorensis NBRC 16594]
MLQQLRHIPHATRLTGEDYESKVSGRPAYPVEKELVEGRGNRAAPGTACAKPGMNPPRQCVCGDAPIDCPAARPLGINGQASTFTLNPDQFLRHRIALTQYIERDASIT